MARQGQPAEQSPRRAAVLAGRARHRREQLHSFGDPVTRARAHANGPEAVTLPAARLWVLLARRERAAARARM